MSGSAQYWQVYPRIITSASMATMPTAPGSVFDLAGMPPLSALRNRQVYVGVRPFRKGGIRLQRQLISGRKFIHNYGHGGAGVSLAPATALEAARLLDQGAGQVSVLGAGIVGLMTALQCAHQGHRVSVFAQRVPDSISRCPGNACTSEVAPGYWLPDFYEFGDAGQHRERARVAYEYYKQKAKQSKNIYYSDCFEHLGIEQFRNLGLDALNETATEATLSFGSREIKGVRFKTFQVDCPAFLDQLILKARLLGVTFTQIRFDSLADILHNVRSETIINCLAMGSKYIFNDEKVYGLRGHLVHFDHDFNISGVVAADDRTHLYIFRNRILIGFSQEEQDKPQINQEIKRKIQRDALSLYQQMGGQVRPKL